GRREPEESGEVIAKRDQEVIAAQLGRSPRGLAGVAHRCPCGLPDVAETAPRPPDGSPFPTLYYLTCPRANAAVSKLEASGLPAPPGEGGASSGNRAAAARHAVGGRHARASEVPARAGRSRACRGPREPVRPRGAGRCGRMVATGTMCPAGHLMTCRVAAVDCGTNSLRLLVADVDLDRAEVHDLARRMEIVRLGQGVDKTGRLAPAALARTIGVLRDYAGII